MNWKKKFLPYQAQPFESLNQEGGEGGGLRGQDTKIKGNINWLKWSFAWIVIALKAYLMQNFSLVAFPDTMSQNFPLTREWVIDFWIFTPRK